MRFPVRPILGRLPGWIEARLQRFFRVDPSVLMDPSVTPAQFRAAVSLLHVGETIKITGLNRHPQADALLIDHVDLSTSVILDIGASDGSTSLELINKLPAFDQYIVADLFIKIHAVQGSRQTLFFDGTGSCILVVGRRLIAWPAQSRIVRALYAARIRWTSAHVHTDHEILLLNPAIQAEMKRNTRISFQEHDIFQPWAGDQPDVIKVANVLRRLYFEDDQIRAALRRLLTTLPEGGHLLIVDNPRIAGIGCRGGLYQRREGRFALVAATDEEAEVADLVASVALPA